MTGTHYIGIDWATEVSVVSAVNYEGAEIFRSRVRTEGILMQRCIESVPQPRQVAIEEGTLADWLFRELQGHAAKVIVCRKSGEKNRRARSKGDDRDALDLAQRLRVNDVKAVWHGGGEERRRLMQLLGTYVSLTQDSTRYKNRLRALWRAEGLKGGKKSYETQTRCAAVAALPLEETRMRAFSYGRLLDEVTLERIKVLRMLLRQARKTVLYRRVIQSPGIGPVSAAALSAIIYNAERFPNRKKFYTYCGLGVIEHDSSQYFVDKKSGNIKRKGRVVTYGLNSDFNRVLKWVFKRAALQLSRGAWNKEYQRLCQKKSEPIARLTLARKVAAIVLRLGKKGEKFNALNVFASDK